MHIVIHSSIGLVGGLVFESPGFFVASIFPDVVLIGNEIKLLVKKQKFNPQKVDSISITLYYLTHSLWIVILSFFLFDSLVATAIMIHQVVDWFSHTGVFETKPFYPVCHKSIKQLLKI